MIKGRGATENPHNRYSRLRVVKADEDFVYDMVNTADVDGVRKIPTQLLPERSVSIISKNQSPDLNFDRSINPYKGCEHGCIYCFARPTHAYLDLSPGIDFETKIFYKTNVSALLADAFSKKSYECRPIAIGTNTDPYQPAEKQLRVMREILEVLLAHKHPVSIVTKSQLVLRDLDLLRQLAEQGLVKVMVSVTTLSNHLKAKLEPRTSNPSARLRTIEGLGEAGVPVGAMVAPMIPYINDHELEDIVAECAQHGAQAMNYILLRLPLEVAPLFERWLEVHFPLRAEKVMSIVRQTRKGKNYDSAWGQRMRGTGVFAQLLAKRFAVAVKRHNLSARTMADLRTDRFVPRLTGRAASVVGESPVQEDLFP